MYGIYIENYPDNENVSFVVSGIQNGHVGVSGTEETFTNDMCAFGFHKVVEVDWYDVNDNFLRPKKELTNEQQNDFVIYSVFCEKTLSCSYVGLEISGKTYDIINHLMPLTIEDVRKMFISDCCLIENFNEATDDRFFAKWIKNNTLSHEAYEVYAAVVKLYDYFYRESENCDWSKCMIHTWDVGFYQVMRAIRDLDSNEGMELIRKFNEKLETLRKKLEPVVYDCGVLKKTIVKN